MRALVVLSILPALPLAGCGPKALALSDDPVTRAAQCAVVSTAKARLATKDVRAALPFADQARTLHYAALVASEGGGFDQDRAAAVVKQLPVVEPGITSAKWQPLAPECDAAFPQARGPAKLPAETGDAQLGCSLLADYVESAMRSQEATYADQLGPVTKMRIALDSKLGARFARAGQKSMGAQQDARGAAMNRIVHAGAIGPVLEECVERFGAKNA